MTVYLGKRRVELILLGGAHTVGDIVIHAPDENVMFTGDIVKYYSSCDCGDGDFGDWGQTLDTIASFEIDAIAPGRGAALVGCDLVNAALVNT